MDNGGPGQNRDSVEIGGRKMFLLEGQGNFGAARNNAPGTFWLF